MTSLSRPLGTFVSLGALCALCGLGALSACGSSDSASGTGGAGGQASCPQVVTSARDVIEQAPDGEKDCATSVCNYQTQEGCADTLSCRPSFPAGSTTVTPVCEPFGTGKTADTCQTSQDCARGYICATMVPGSKDGTVAPISRCYKQCCSGDWTACDAGTSCLRQFDVLFPDNHQEHPVDLCVPTGTCDVFDPTSCANDPDPPARECKIADPTGAVACLPKSDRKLGDVCSPTTGGCAQGLTCVLDALDAQPPAHCHRLCRPETCGEPACPASEGYCVHYNRDPPGVGECANISLSR